MSSIAPTPQQPYIPPAGAASLPGAGTSSAVLEAVDRIATAAEHTQEDELARRNHIVDMSTIMDPRRAPAAGANGVPKVYAAIAKAMQTIGRVGVGKHGTNQDQNYKFRSIDDVYGAVSAGLIEGGLLILPAVITRDLVEHRTAAGKANWRVTLKMMYTFIAVSDGSSHEVGPFFGEAFDTSDKATNKALTVAYKYMLIEVFCIPLKGIDDADEHTPEVEHGTTVATPTKGKRDPQRDAQLYDEDFASEQDLVKLRAKLEEHAIPEEAFCKAGDIEKLEKLGTANIEAAYHWIESVVKKRAKKAAEEAKAAAAPQSSAATDLPKPLMDREPGSDDDEPGPVDELAGMEERTYGVALAGTGETLGTFAGKRLQIGGIILVKDVSYRIVELLKLDTQTPIIVAELAQKPAPAPAPAKKGAK